MENMRRVKVSYWTISGEGSIFIPPEKKLKNWFFEVLRGYQNGKLLPLSNCLYQDTDFRQTLNIPPPKKQIYT